MQFKQFDLYSPLYGETVLSLYFEKFQGQYGALHNWHALISFKDYQRLNKKARDIQAATVLHLLTIEIKIINLIMGECEVTETKKVVIQF